MFDLRDPVKAANYVLDAMKRKDVNALISVFDSYNRVIAASLGHKQIRKSLSKAVELASSKFRGINSINELREVYKSNHEVTGDLYVVAAKVLQEHDVVFVIALVKEGDRYLFDHIDGASAKDYYRWKVLWRASKK